MTAQGIRAAASPCLRKQYPLLLILFLLLSLAACASAQERSGATVPGDLESMAVYQTLRDSVGQDMTGGELAAAFEAMCRMDVDCLSDMVLVEYTPGSGGDTFVVHLARQFEFAGESEFVQLHLNLVFPMAEGLETLSGCQWYTPGAPDLTVLTDTLGTLTPLETSVSIDWTW